MNTRLMLAIVGALTLGCGSAEPKFPELVKCAPEADELVKTVEDALARSDWRDLLFDLFEQHGDSAICAIDQFANATEGGVGPKNARDSSLVRAKTFLAGLGTKIER